MAAFSPDSADSLAAGLGAFILGSAVFAGSLVAGIKRYRLLRRAKRATGTVTAVDTTRRRDGTVMFYPTFSFKSEDGVEHGWRRSIGENRNSYPVGTQVPVIYDPSDPQIASIDTFAETFGPAIMFGLLGLFFAGVGWALAPHDLPGMKAAVEYFLRTNLSGIGLDKLFKK